MKRFEKFKKQTLYPVLTAEDRSAISAIWDQYGLTFQELRLVSEKARDLQMWNETSFAEMWESLERQAPDGLADGVQRKKYLLRQIDVKFRKIQRKPKVYPGSYPAVTRPPLRLVVKNSGKKIYGDCPVASPRTVCCNLKTIDAVENCAFGCSYCTIQTFYGADAVMDGRLREKLEAIRLKADRFYHFCTGQSSDSLVWGNREGGLDALCDFARRHPNILLEFKAKSDNVSYFLTHQVPRNIVCSWSLNTETVIRQEEYFTPNLERRLVAARKVADRGIKVAFHFHPLVYYQEWETDYRELARRIQWLFLPQEVLFISFGSVTLIKPVIREIRKRGLPSKILQMEMARDPHGKFTYPDELKLKLFRAMRGAFRPWQRRVFMYLCMEHAGLWDRLFGRHYATNEAFEMDFGRRTMSKIFGAGWTAGRKISGRVGD